MGFWWCMICFSSYAVENNFAGSLKEYYYRLHIVIILHRCVFVGTLTQFLNKIIQHENAYYAYNI